MSGSPNSAIVLQNVTLAYDGHPAVHHLSGAFERGSADRNRRSEWVCEEHADEGADGLAPAGRRSDPVCRFGWRRYRLSPPTRRNRKAFSDFGDADCAAWPLASDRLGASGDPESCARKRNELSPRSASRGSRGDLSKPCPPVRFQRVLFARLIAQDAELILLDEPLAAVARHRMLRSRLPARGRRPRRARARRFSSPRRP
jgi:zinc/manganese transport system ATP-binding protein